MRFIIPLILLTVLGIVFVKYLLLKERSRLMKQELNKKTEKQIETVELTTWDKKQMFKLFRKKIEYISMIKTVNQYEFFYKRGEFFIGGVNSDYDVIKVQVRKVRINGQSLFNMDVLAWTDKDDYKKEYKPSKEILEVMVKEETLKEQTLFVMNQFFTNENKVKEEITINND